MISEVRCMIAEIRCMIVKTRNRIEEVRSMISQIRLQDNTDEMYVYWHGKCTEKLRLHTH